MPDPEQVITTQTCRMLAHKTHRKCLTTGGGTGQPRTIEHKPELLPCVECKKALGQYPATRGFVLPEAGPALDAINSQVHNGITMDEVRRIAYRAVEPIKREFEDQQWREQMVSSVPDCLGWDAKPDEREVATAAVSKAIAELPVGTSHSAMEQARDRALTAFKTTIKERDTKRWREFGERLRGAR